MKNMLKKLLNHVLLLGYTEKVFEYLRASDFCFATSKREGLPVNIMEAMKLKVPVIAKRNRGHLELLEKNGLYGFLYNTETPSEVAEIISRFFNETNRTLLNDVEERAAKKVNDYSFGNVFPLIYQIYIMDNNG